MVFVYVSLVALAGTSLLLWFRLWQEKTAWRRLLLWAEGNEYKIQDAKVRRWAQRPPHISSSVLQVVFDVRLRAPGIGERDGFVRVGGYFSGVGSGPVDVFWNR